MGNRNNVQRQLENLEKRFDRVSGQIDSISKHLSEKQKPSQSVWERFRERAPVVTFVAMAVTLAGIALTQWSAANKRFEEHARFEERTTIRLDTIEKTLAKLDKIEDELREIRALIASLHPELNSPRKIAGKLTAAAIKSAGAHFVEAAERRPEAWATALDYVGYRSELNKPQLPTGPFEPLNGKWEYYNPTVPGWKTPQLAWTPNNGVPARLAARLDRIGVDKNAAQPIGPALLFLTGGSTSLDGLHLRNVILHGVEVHYSGKPAILENVFFVDCRFVVDNDDNGRQFARQMLSSADRITWSAQAQTPLKPQAD